MPGEAPELPNTKNDAAAADVEIAYDRNKSIDMASKFRSAFFIDALDIGNLDILCDVAKSSGLDRNAINTSIHDGSAMAAFGRVNARLPEIKTTEYKGQSILCHRWRPASTVRQRRVSCSSRQCRRTIENSSR